MLRRALLALLLLLAAAPPALAQQPQLTTPPQGPTSPNAISRAQRPDVAPAAHRLSANEAKALGVRDPTFAAERRAKGARRVEVFLKGQTRWQVSAYDRRGKEVAQVLIDDRNARVTESWTGFQVPWTMARGYPGAFGRKVNAPWVWLPLAALFLLALAPRRLRSWRTVDVAVLTAFGAAYAVFNTGRIDVSVPLQYPLLGYLLLRLLLLGLGRARHEHHPSLLPVGVLGTGLVFLLGFRAGLNVTDSNVIDVGYAGVIGGDVLADGRQLWGGFPQDNQRGDTYGPIAYLAYVPFEQLWPHTGAWGKLWAAHAVSIVADLACVGLLYAIGRRLRDHATGVLLAFAWAACPFTLLVLNTNGNDAIVGALVLGALLGASSGAARGACIALAGWAKFAPLGLGPLFLLHGRRDKGPFLLAFAGVTLLSAVVVLYWGDAAQFPDRTIAFQAERGSPFSIWGAQGWEGAQRVVQVLGVVIAVGAGLVPSRRRDTAGLAALTGAVLIALQLGVTHWFYLYLAWWLGPLLVAILVTPAPAARPTAPAAARSTPPVAAAASSG